MALKACSRPTTSSTKFYTLRANENVTETDVWIVGTYYRDDYGMRYAISATENPEINEFIKEAFSSSSVFNWTGPYNFPCMDRKISAMIWDISVVTKGNPIRIMPTKLYYMTPVDAAISKISIPQSDDEVEVKRLDLDSGTDFFLKTWKYGMKNSDMAIRKLLENNLSAGVYVNGKVVCGININGIGLMGMLYTLEEYRQRGFASLAQAFLVKSEASIGAFPCSAVEVNNLPSNKFQEKNGFTLSHVADFISHSPS